MSDSGNAVPPKDERSDSSDGEDEFYDIDVSKETTDYVSRTSDSTTKEETVKFHVEFPANEDFKDRFFEAQDRLGELEEELRSTRGRLKTLENACENTEEKIGVLKNAAFSYHRTFSEHEITYKTVVEENRELKITIQKLQTTIRKIKQEREKANEIKRTINEHLKEQLDAATKENEELEKQLDELRALNSNNICKYCGHDRNHEGADLKQELESLKLKFDSIQTEKDRLQKDKEELRNEISDLEKKLKDLRIKLSADDEIIEEMKKQILDFHSQIAESEDNCDSSRSRNIELEKEMSVLRGLMTELESKLEDEKESKEDLIREGTQRLEVQNKKISQLEMNLKEVCKEKELLNLQFVDSKNKAERDVKHWTKQLNEAHVRAELFKKEVSDKEKKLVQLRVENEELKGLQDDIAALQRQLKDAQDREMERFADEISEDEPDGDKPDSADANEVVSDDEDEQKRLEQENKELRQELEQLRDDVISLQSELAGEKKRLEQENKELKQELEQLRDEIISLQSELAGYVREAEKAKSQEDGGVQHLVVVQSAAPLARIEEDFSDNDDVDEERIVAVGEVSNLGALPKEPTDSWSSQDYDKSQIQELEELLERVKAEKQKLEDCLEESEGRAKKTTDELSKTISHLSEKCEEMRKELVEKEIIINTLRKEQAQDKNTFHDLEEKVREQEYIEEELEKARQDLNDLKSLAVTDDYKEKYEELKAKYDKIVVDKEKLENEKKEIAKEKAELKNELNEINQTLEKGKEMYAQVCDDNDDLKKDKKKLEEEVKFLSEELKEEEDLHISERDKLAADNKAFKEKIGRLETEIAELKGKLKGREDADNWRKKHDDLKRETNSLQSEKKRLERSLGRSEDEHEDTKSKYSKTRRELSDAHAETATLRRQVSELKLSTIATVDIEKELRNVKETLRKKEEECTELENELAKVKETLKRKEEECERYLEELEQLKRSLNRQASEDGWQEKFESLKLKLDEVEDEKNSLQKEKNNLQNELRKDSEKLAEVEIKLSQANMEIEGLSKDFHKSHTRITHLEIELQRASKQKQQAEEQAKWIKKELLTREETIGRLGKELSDKNKAIENMDGDKDNEILMLEREIQLLQSRIPASEKDESVLHNQISLLEINVKEVQEQLDRKTSQLDECEKKNETLSVRVVELSKEIQSLYRRYEESRATLAQLRAGQPVPAEKAETTSLTIDVEGNPEVQLGVFVQERVRSSSRVITSGHGRSVSELEVPVCQLPGTVIIGEPVSLTVDYKEQRSPVVSHPSELTASEPEDDAEASLPQEIEEEEDLPPVVFKATEVYSAPPPISHSPPPTNPERILISAQALPQPQKPKSIDAERFPFLKGSGVTLNAGAFQPVPSTKSGQPEEESDETAAQRRFRAISREELFRLDGLLHAHAHHQDPPDDGLYNGEQDIRRDEGYPNEVDYPMEMNGQDRHEWREPPPYDWEREEEPAAQPAQEAYTNESVPDEVFAEDYNRFSDPYKKPPRKPESTYTRRIIGVYDNDGNLIGYQEVYEEKTDEDYPDEVNGGVVPYPDPYEYRGMPKPHGTQQHPSENVPYAKGTRQRSEDDFGYPYDRNGNTTKERRYRGDPEERRFIKSKHDKKNDTNYRHGHGERYGHLNGDDNRRNRQSGEVRQYASGTYL